VGDAGAVFSNPAGIATIRHLAVEAAYQRLPGGTAVGSGALALRAGRLSWGFGAAALDTSGALVRATDLLGLSSLVFRASFIAVGTSVKYVRETLGATTADAWAGDVGVAIAIFDLMAFGASVQNLGGDLGGGVGCRVRGGGGAVGRTVLGCDGPPDGARAAAVGPRGAPPAALGADRRAGAARARAAAERRRPLSRAGGSRRGTHLPEASLHRPARRRPADHG